MDQPMTLGPMLGRCAHLAKARMDARLSGCDVTPVQTHVLMYLHRHGGQALQCQVTAFLRVKPSTANGILDRMEERELVTRTDAIIAVFSLSTSATGQLLSSESRCSPKKHCFKL